MAKKEQKRLICEIQMCSLSASDNPTKMPVEFILHDFEFSHNNTRIQKIVAQKALPTLKDMPIVAKYYSVSEGGADDDALGGHEAHLTESRDGNLQVSTATIAIGVFNGEAYIDTVEVNGETKEVVKGKGILWASRYPDIVGLLQEWWNNDIPITSSMEILYDEYKVKEGKEDILNYVYEGHCVLNSEERGNHDVVLPAYDISKVTQFQRLVAEALQKEKTTDYINNVSEEEKEMANETFKKVFELSHDDVRSRLYQTLRETLTVDEYYDAYICEVFDSYFIMCTCDGYFKINYTKTNDAIAVDMTNKVKVEMGWVADSASNDNTDGEPMGDSGDMGGDGSGDMGDSAMMSADEQSSEADGVESLDAACKKKKQNSEVENKSIDSTELLDSDIISTLKSEKEALAKQFNDATEKLTALSALVDELKPIKEQFEKEKLDKAISDKQEYFLAKFEAVKAREKFDTEEVQNLIVLSIHDSAEGKNALLQLNTILVDLVVTDKIPEKKSIKEFASKMDKLVPSSSSFEDRYKD